VDCIGYGNLGKVLEYKAYAFGAREAIVFEDGEGRVARFSYAQFNDRANRYANLFAAKGIKKGDKVVVHMRNCPEHLFAWFGLAKIGAVMVPTNVLSTPPEMEHFINYADAVAVVTQPDYLALIRETLPKCMGLRELFVARTSLAYPNRELFPDVVLLDEMLAEASPAAPQVAVSPDDDALIIFSNNTNAEHSAVELTHANAVFAGIFGAQLFKMTPADRDFMVLPLFHVNALFISAMPAITAGAAVIMTEQFSASRYMEQVRRHGVTTASLVGATVRMVLNQPAHELDGQNDLRLIKFAIPVSDEEWQMFETRFNVRLCDLWGLTETLGATTINPIDGKFKRNCVGLPRLGNEVKIVDESGIEAPVNTPGEMVVKGVPGRTIMKGYYKEPAATANIIRDGWLFTGDRGYMDEEGYFHFLDRIKNVIKRAGENIAAPEVERVIAQHHKVKDVVVIAAPDPIRDEALTAFIVLKDGTTCTEEEIVTWCSQRLAKFKIPSFIKFRGSLPRDGSGAVLKNILKREITTH
jgi:crotonobetaine/carnitine-CoA ligase